MERHWALIKKNIVQGVIVADQDFLQHIEKDYDLIIEVDENRPEPGTSYYPETQEFISNKDHTHEIEQDADLHFLGEVKPFEPFAISKFDVSYENGWVHIGCKRYSATGMLHALHRLVEDKEPVSEWFNISDGTPGHGKFRVTWEDAKLVYEKLKEAAK